MAQPRQPIPSRAPAPRNLKARLVVGKYPAAEALEEAITIALERYQKELDSDDDLSSDAEEDLPAPGSSRALRARARLRVHLETLFGSTDVEVVRKTMTLLEETSVRPATRQLYKKAMKEFLRFCDSQTPPANVDDLLIADAVSARTPTPCLHVTTTSHISNVLWRVSYSTSRSLGAAGRPACPVPTEL